MSAPSLAELDERTESRVRPAASGEERLSPFLEWSEADRRGIDAGDLIRAPRSLLVDLVQDPAALVKRLDAADSARETVLTAAGAVAASTSAFALAIAHLFAIELVKLAAISALASADVLLALAASLGPIYGASILLAARLPLRTLVAILLCSAATGTLLLAALTPVMVGLWRLDPMWIGPTALLACFLMGAWRGYGFGA